MKRSPPCNGIVPRGDSAATPPAVTVDSDGSPSPKKSKTDPGAEEERHFYALYEDVLHHIQDKTGVSDEMIYSGVMTIRESFHYEQGHNFSDVDLTRPDNLCGYLFRYGPHGSGLVRCKLLEAVRQCPVLETSLTKKKRLRVVSLGGGPGNDAVGFCSALHELDVRNGVKDLTLDMTVVDAVREWSECVDRVNHLARSGCYGNVSEMFRRNRAKLTFDRADLPADPVRSEAAYRALKRADVVLVCKLLSILSWPQKKDLIRSLHSTVRDDALILLIDTPFRIESWAEFDVLHVSEEEDEYRMREQHFRFGTNDSFGSRSRLAVIRKHFACETDSQSDID